MPDTSLKQDMINALHDFTGSEISLLSEARVRLHKEDAFIAATASLLTEEDDLLQRAGGWLLLETVRAGEHSAGTVLSLIAKDVMQLSDWQAVLTILQMFDELDVPVTGADDLAGFATGYLTHKRPFLRAWSMNALCRLSHHHPHLLPAARTAHNAAISDSAASVRARARNTKRP